MINGKQMKTLTKYLLHSLVISLSIPIAAIVGVGLMAIVELDTTDIVNLFDMSNYVEAEWFIIRLCLLHGVISTLLCRALGAEWLFLEKW